MSPASSFFNFSQSKKIYFFFASYYGLKSLESSESLLFL